MKPGLTQEMKDARLKFCMEHKDWTIEDQKRVIWMDETSVLLGHRRGAVRVQRTVMESIEPVQSTSRNRWKGASEMMFQGAYSYDYKGPCHIWKKETTKEKKQADIEIEKMNNELEAIVKEQWELTTGMRRLELRNLPGKQPKWQFNIKNGKIARGLKNGGIDWWRY